MQSESGQALDYEKAAGRRSRRLRLGLLAVVAVLVVSPFLANAYAGLMYDGVAPGMSRAKVERLLWAFRAHRSAPYNAITAGQSAVEYELLGFGKYTMIKVIYNADGTVAYPIPSFGN